MPRLLHIGMLTVLSILWACEREQELVSMEERYIALDLPAHFPEPDMPEDNRLTEARVALGRKLFYDPVLSRDFTTSCASCHRQELAFADDQPVSPGVSGRLGFRNAPTLTNVAWASPLHKDGGVVKLDIQATAPIEDHAEMDFQGLLAAQRLSDMPEYVKMSMRAYGQAPSTFVITRALAAFQRTMVSSHAPYDAWMQGDGQALSDEALAGMMLFFSDRLRCGDCHAGFNFSDNSFRNNGLYLQYDDPGRGRITGPEDDGKFRVPTLRNIALTAPYMHNGSLSDLDAVIDHYASGGAGHPNQDTLVNGFSITDLERSNLLAFLEALTDQTFISESNLAEPPH